MNFHIFRNVRVFDDTAGEWVTSDVQVKDGKILSVTKSCDRDRGDNDSSDHPQATVHDNISGCVMTPGMHDNHLHFVNWMQGRAMVDFSYLDDLLNREDKVVAGRMESAANALMETLVNRKEDQGGVEVIVGKSYAASLLDLSEQQCKARELLDTIVSKDIPVVIYAKDLHTTWCNTAALKLIDDADTEGRGYGPNGESNVVANTSGIIREATVFVMVSIVEKIMRVPTSLWREAMEECFSLGITSVVSMESPHGISIIDSNLAASEDVRDSLEFAGFVMCGPDWRRGLDIFGQRMSRSAEKTNGEFDLLGVKFFLDGSLGSSTAWMLDSYENSDSRGLKFVEEEDFTEAVRVCHAEGAVVAVHAIGDAATNMAIQSILSAQANGNETRKENRSKSSKSSSIEHFQLVTPKAMSQLGDNLGKPIILSMQPCHLIDEFDRAKERWGEARMKHAYPVKSAWETGHPVRFGSDAPVEPLLPMRNIYACEMSWNEGERVPREVSLAMSTRAGSLSIKPGDVADIAVWPSKLIDEKDASRLTHLKTICTMRAGKIVYICRDHS